jgi:glyceraldehyde-3-phosphate dehydrogenase (NAD(P)+) (phosphorylating)
LSKVKVGVVGYGTIGTRLAAGVILQKDMEVVGVADIVPTLATRALKELGMPYKLYSLTSDAIQRFQEAGIPVSGTIEDLLSTVDIVLDATPAGIGAKNKELYRKYHVKAIFQGGEKREVADVFFHGNANYEKGVGKKFLKLTSCNTTGLIRAVDCLDKAVGIERVAMTIIRRSADPGDTNRGYVDLAKVDPVPSHQATDLMLVMPHIRATGLLVHVPTTHGHIINIIATPKKALSRQVALEQFHNNPRIRVVRIADGFDSNTALFKYARFLLNPRADMYQIDVPQESVVVPETIDGIRAAIPMQSDPIEGVKLTNYYLGLN